MNFPQLPESTRLSRLQPPSGRVRMVMDTDTYNEVDDQFAIAHALLSPQNMTVEAFYAAPYFNNRSSGPADGMEKSYAEILRLLELIRQAPNGPDYNGPVLRGSVDYLNADFKPQENDAVRDLVSRALAAPDDDPLYVVAIGAITNVASAILLEPKIIEHIVVVWLGGHALHWPHTREFNLKQDVRAAQVLVDCGAPLVLLPCMGVVSHLHTTIPELDAHVAGRSALGDYLVDIVKGYHEDHTGWSKQIWDVAATAYLVNPSWTPSVLEHSPIVTDQVTWSRNAGRHLIRYVHHIERDPIFRDLFAKLAMLGG
ncbi:MAG: nucleoside hydrolase [Caldilineaceae bacterium]|nr:nucleoside hydrolase [Caldilineaceae bacterium]